MINKVEICGVTTSKLPVLSNEEKEELLKKIKNGDQEAREVFVKGNLKLVLSVIKNFYGRGENLDDLFQIGCVGLIKAMDNFDVNMNVKFSTYAVPMIIGEIRRYLRDNNIIRVSRSVRDLGYKVLAIRERAKKENKREPTIEEIAKELKADKDDIIIAMESNNSIESIEGTSSQSDKEGKKLSILDKISTGKNEEEIITNKILLKELDERDREIILLRFFKEKTQTEVARILGISQVQVSRIERKVLDKMKNKLTSA